MNNSLIKGFPILFVILLIFFVNSICAQSGYPILRLSTGEQRNYIRKIIVSRDKRFFIFCGEDKTIQIRDSRTGELIETIHGEISERAKGTLYAIALSPDEKWLAVGGILDEVRPATGNIKIYDFVTKKPLILLKGHLSSVKALEFTDDGKYLVSGSFDRTIRVWNTETWKCVSVKKENIDFVYDLKIIDNHIYAVSFDRTLKKWNLSDSTSLKTVISKSAIHALGKLPSNLLLTVYIDDYFYLLDTSFQKLDSIYFPGSSIGSYSASSDGKFMVFSPFWDGDAIFAEIRNNKFKMAFSLDASFINNNATAFIDNETFVYPNYTRNITINKITQENGAVNIQTLKKIQSPKLIPVNIKYNKNAISFFRTEENSTIVKDSISFDLENFSAFFKKGNDKMQIENTRKKNILEYLGRAESVMQLKNKTKLGLPFSINSYAGWGLQNIIPISDNYWLIGSTGAATVVDNDARTYCRLTVEYCEINELALSPDSNLFITCGTDRKILFWRKKDILSLPDNDTILSYSVFNSINRQKDSITDFREIKDFINCPLVSCWDSIINFLLKDSTHYNQLIAEMRFMKYYARSKRIQPFAMLYFSDNREWVLSSPYGYFTSSANGSELILWHLNQGDLNTPLVLPAKALYDKFYRPDIINEMFKKNKTAKEILEEKGESVYTIEQAMKGIPIVNIEADTTNTFSTQIINLKINIKEKDNKNITKVTLKLNGKAVSENLISSISKDENEKSITYIYNIPLVSGENNFCVISKNSDSIESIPSFYRYYSHLKKNTSNLFLFCIGINQYMSDSLTLTLAVDDSKAIFDELGNRKVFPFDSIIKYELYDKNATRKKIQQVFEKIKKEIQQQDVLVVFYSGHAITTTGSVDKLSEFYMATTELKSLNPDRKEINDECISSTELNNIFSNMPTDKQLLLLDACQSAGASLSFKRNRSINNLSKNTGVTIFSASHTNQEAFEYSKLSHGVFTYCLIEGLNGAADEAENSFTDQKITVYELIDYVKDRLPELIRTFGDYDQSPVSFKGSVDFVIAVK